MKIKLFKNGALITMERVGGMYVVLCRDPAGRVHDKVRCDTYRDASEYRRAFCRVARGL